MRVIVPRACVLAAVSLAACATSTQRGASATQTGASTSSPLSPAGQWEGELRSPNSLPLGLTIVLDSTTNGWHGTIATSDPGERPLTFASIARTGDSLVLRLPASGDNAVIRGRLSADARFIEGTVDSSDQTFRLARAGTDDAARLTMMARRIDASRRHALSLMDTVTRAKPNDNPDSARLVTSDIALFWSALDHATSPDSLATALQREYLDRASVGVHDFIPGRIMSAEDLAAYVSSHRPRYDSVRAANLDVSRADSAIRAAFRKLKTLYPPAVFPDVYFVIGRFNSGGTSSRHGLLIGAEMYRDPSRLPSIVSHELIHYQQRCSAPTLLEHAFMEGSADFIGEMISGAQINNAAREYGLAHEHELWHEFSQHFADRNFYPWMYGRPRDGKPNDLGYFIGYRIAQAYYNKASDKAQALREIILACGDDVKQILAKSGYHP